MRLAILTLCAALLLPIGVVAKPIYELVVGTRWHYTVNGDQNNPVHSLIRRVKTIGSHQWYELSEYGDRFWIRNTAKGQVEAVDWFNAEPNSKQLVVTSLVYKFPATVGDAWLIGDSKVSYTGTVNVTVPAGRFECHVYHFDLGDNQYSQSCVAESVGVVYSVFVGADGTKHTSELTFISSAEEPHTYPNRSNL